MGNYAQIKDQQPELVDCFFAFSNEQFAKGLDKFNLKKEDIVVGGGGLYGTKEALLKLNDYYDKQHDRIANECDPQEVYNHEHNNHECSYVGDDAEAMKIVVAYFDIDKAKTVKRSRARMTVEQILESIKKS